MKIDLESVVTSVSRINSDLLVTVQHADGEGPQFVREVQFGCSYDAAKNPHVGQRVRITIEVLDA